MSSLSKAIIGTLLSSLALQVTANPVDTRSVYAEHAMRRRAAMRVLATTDTTTHTLDWVERDSQVAGTGTVANPPPIRNANSTNVNRPTTELQQTGATKGPSGTVPIPRVNGTYLTGFASKSLPEIRAEGAAKSKRSYAGNHWYVSSNQNVDNYGGSATYSLFKAYVANDNDFSLLQTAVTKSDTNGGQTLEAGWINYPAQGSEPHLFTYFTTDGYSSNADNKGGWNQDVAGWVQYSDSVYPGTVISPTSVIGGSQYEIDIEYYLYGGNWWLSVLDEWIGYYPATLFSDGVSGTTLADKSDVILYYGEIYQSEDDLTTTDMGSGEFAAAGNGQAAYIRNMNYIDTSVYLEDYDASFGDSDSSRYSHDTHLKSGTSWGSYVYLGGPGEGGVVGA